MFRELRKSKIVPTVEALDFTIIAMAVVAADKAVLRRSSADGWTRKIELCVIYMKRLNGGKKKES